MNFNFHSPNAFHQYQNEQKDKSSHSLDRSLNYGEQPEGSFRRKLPPGELDQDDEDAKMNYGEQYKDCEHEEFHDEIYGREVDGTSGDG
jgi:hypothetical protein